MRILVCNVDESPCQVANQAAIVINDAFAPELFGITAEAITKVYAWGFGAVLLAFLIGYGGAVAIRVLRNL